MILGEVTGVDKDKKCVLGNSADRTGVPIPEFERFAPGLKNLADAVAVRNKIVQVFEQAEAEEDPARHRDLLTLVLVGAGPTGVEMARAIAVLVRSTLKSEFRRINPELIRIALLDRAPRILGSFRRTSPKRLRNGLIAWA